MKKLFLTAFISLFLLSSLHAQNSPVISYQGLIQGADGAPIKDSTYPITVLIWRDTTQGTPIWQDVFQTEVRGGVFNILLGSQSPLPAPSDMDHPLWISTSIGEASAAYPRSALSAVPLAINVADRAITTAKLADSSVTPQKMNMNYVSSISVNGQQVTGNGTALNIAGGDGVGVLFDPNTNSLYLSSTGTSAGPGKGGKTLSLGDTIVGFWNTLGFPVSGVAGAANQVLHGDGGVSSGPTWGSVNLTSDVSGILPWANGGTGGIPQWGGGGDNYAGLFSVVGGGWLDTAVSMSSVVAGGEFNKALDTDATVSGGGANTASGIYSTVSGGTQNLARDSASVVAGGLNNGASYEGAVGGGLSNGADTLSAIPGGYKLTLGNYSFGFNAPGLNSTPASAGPDVAYFGNVDLVISSSDTIARQLRICTPGLGGSSNYTSFQNNSSINIHYILPMSQGSINQVLTNDGTGQLSWTNKDSISGAWAITGNPGTTPPTNFLGTTDSNSLEFHIFNTGSSTYGDKRVMRYEVNDTSANLLGGYHDNAIIPLDTSLHSHIVGVVIAGGGANGHLNIVKGSYAVVSGGRENTDTAYAFVGGGDSNRAMGIYSSVMGGLNNSASGSFSSVGGGSGNVSVGDHSVIAGGSSNKDTTLSFVGGGNSNQAAGAYSVVTGGQGNKDTTLAFVGGGDSNRAMGVSSIIVGGAKNTIDSAASYASVLGGQNNLIQDSGAVIVGGMNNSILLTNSTYRSGLNCFIGGGNNNKIDGLGRDTSKHEVADGSAIVAGQNNTAREDNSFIGAGRNNTINDGESFIGGGDSNYINWGYSGIVTGSQDSIIAGYNSVIGAGQSNNIDTASYSFIGSGEDNFMNGDDAFIGAGDENSIFAPNSGIGSGDSNVIGPAAQYSFVAAGYNDSALAFNSFVGAGEGNITDTGATHEVGSYASIPGGQGLKTQSYAQTALGFYNVPAGSTTDAWNAKTNGDDPLVIVGNGLRDTGHTSRRSDAFTIANRGYSSAYDNIPDSIATRMGSTYANNTIEAWGNVHPADSVPFDDIGVASVTDTGGNSGVYIIILNVVNQDGSPHIFTTGKASITASIEPGASGVPGFISVSELSTAPPYGTVNRPWFMLITYSPATEKPLDTYGFQFHVVAR